MWGKGGGFTAEGRIKPENYITIQGWMVTELGLSGKALQLYALLYGFSQEKGGGYSGRQDYLMEWLGCTRRSILNYITELKGKGLLLETTAATGQKVLRAVRRSCAKNARDAQNLPTECAKIDLDDAQNLPPADENSALPTLYNNRDTSIYTYSGRAQRTPTPPTTEEVEAYCRERGNDIDASRFVDYYAVSGWKRGGKSIEDWRALIRLWEQNGRANKNPPAGTAGAWGGDWSKRGYDPAKSGYDPWKNGGNGSKSGCDPSKSDCDPSKTDYDTSNSSFDESRASYDASKTSFDLEEFWKAAVKRSYGES